MVVQDVADEPRARTILVQWESFLPLFRKVAPKGARSA